MTDHAFDRAELAEAVGNDIADMAHFWMLRKFQFLEPAREQFEIIVDPWLSYCTEPSQNEIMAYNMAFTDWLLFERPYRHGKTLLELYVDEPPASLSPASLKRLEQVRDTQYFSRFGILDKDPASGMVVLKDTRTDHRFDVYDPHIVQKEHWSDGAIAVRLACVDDVWLTAGQLYLYDIARLSDTAVDGPGAVHPEDLQDGFDTSCIASGPRHHGRPGAVRKVAQHLRAGVGVGDGWLSPALPFAFLSRSVTFGDKKPAYLLQIETNAWAPLVCLNL